MKKNSLLFVNLLKSQQLVLLLALLLYSCNREQNRTPTLTDTTKVTEAKGFIKPVDSIKPPHVVLLDTTAKPDIINVPVSAGGFYSIKAPFVEKKIPLLPPESRHAVFYSLMENYTTDQGLALDAILCGLMDKAGNLWFGTNGGGVSRYDGKSFTNFTTAQGLANNDVRCLLEDNKGNLWFGTYGGGVSVYDGKGFTTYTVAQGLANNDVRSIFQDKKGNIWLGTDGGVSCFNGKTFTNITVKEGLTDNSVYSIIEDKNGDFWFGTFRQGVSRYNGKTFTNYTTAQGLANNSVFNITEDKRGTLWFGNDTGEVSCYDGKLFTKYKVPQGSKDNLVLRIMEDKSGNLWFLTQSGELSRFNGTSFTDFIALKGLANAEAQCIIEDKDGNFWFGTYGRGIYRYDGKAVFNFTSAQGLPSQIFCMTEDKSGNLWLGSQGGGVFEYNGNSFTNFTMKQGLPDDNIRSITEDKSGNIWIGTYGGGLSCFDGKSFKNYSTAQGLPKNIITCSLQDSKGNIWFGTFGGGVSRYDGKSFTNYSTAQGLVNNRVKCITEDSKGNIWFGTTVGASCFNGKSFTNYTIDGGLPANYIRCITEDKSGNLWFGTTGGGVCRFDGKSFISYGIVNGLPDNSVLQVVIDSNDNFILGTNYGIAILTGWKENNGHFINKGEGLSNLPNKELVKYTPVFEIYNSSTGYPIKDVNGGQNTIFKDNKGIIWIATGADKTGLVRFDYEALHKNTSPPNVVIQGVKINNENICWGDLETFKAFGRDSAFRHPNIFEEVTTFGMPLNRAQQDTLFTKFGDIAFGPIAKFYPVPSNIELPHSHNNIAFDFAAIEPAKSYLVKYQYKLDGYDKDWSPPSNKTSATFGNIFEGTYVFEVKAKGPFGVWSEPITYTFTVLPPWYRAWWAYILYIIIGISILYFIFRWRTTALRERQKELEKIIEEREKITLDLVQRNKDLEQFAFIVSHNLRAPVANIIGLTREIGNYELTEEERMEMLGGLAGTVNKLDGVIMDLNQILHIKRQINEQKEVVVFSKLVKDIKDQIEQLVKKEKVKIETDFNSVDELFTIKSYLYSVFYNLITNSIKYHKPGVEPVIEIISKRTQDFVFLTFKDNGMGINLEGKEDLVFGLYRRFHTHVEGKGVGLFMCKVQVEALGGTIQIESKVNEGTTFTIKLPV